MSDILVKESSCIYCQSVYTIKESNSTVPMSLCSKKCEEKFIEWSNEPLVFVCLACNGKGFFFNENKGYEEECLACNGTGTEYSTPIK